MREFPGIRQSRGEPWRRWFQSDDEELTVWYEPDGSFRGFQLCYDRQGYERALTWLKAKGYARLRVDHGESEPLTVKRTPVVLPDGAFDAAEVLERFRAAAGGLPDEIARLVAEKIGALIFSR